MALKNIFSQMYRQLLNRESERERYREGRENNELVSCANLRQTFEAKVCTWWPVRCFAGVYVFLFQYVNITHVALVAYKNCSSN